MLRCGIESRRVETIAQGERDINCAVMAESGGDLISEKGLRSPGLRDDLSYRGDGVAGLSRWPSCGLLLV